MLIFRREMDLETVILKKTKHCFNYVCMGMCTLVQLPGYQKTALDSLQLEFCFPNTVLGI